MNRFACPPVPFAPASLVPLASLASFASLDSLVSLGPVSTVLSPDLHGFTIAPVITSDEDKLSATPREQQARRKQEAINERQTSPKFSAVDHSSCEKSNNMDTNKEP